MQGAHLHARADALAHDEAALGHRDAEGRSEEAGRRALPAEHAHSLAAARVVDRDAVERGVGHQDLRGGLG